MNFLAHLYFADLTSDSIVGNLLGDFVKGTPGPPFSQDTIQGIWRHRAIDHFTDTHPVVKQSKQTISPARRRFAGIIIDVCYDYFLSHHWDLYSSVGRSHFIHQAYHQLECYSGYLPTRARPVIQHMIQEDWLGSYHSRRGIGRVLDRISRRMKRPNGLAGAIEEFDAQYDTLNQHFLEFFPALIAYVDALKASEQLTYR